MRERCPECGETRLKIPAPFPHGRMYVAPLGTGGRGVTGVVEEAGKPMFDVADDLELYNVWSNKCRGVQFVCRCGRSPLVRARSETLREEARQALDRGESFWTTKGG